MLAYPIFCIENDPRNPIFGYDVKRRQTDFTAFGRVPRRNKFKSGKIFDSIGTVYDYTGSAGTPRFSSNTCDILDAMLIPGLLFKLIETQVYFGPKLGDGRHACLPDFIDGLIDRIEKFERAKQPELQELLSESHSYTDAIEIVDKWRYFGGRRDLDGHPI